MAGVFQNIYPSSPGEYVPPGGGRTHSPGVRRGGGGVNNSEDARHCSVLYICKYFVAQLHPLLPQRGLIRPTAAQPREKEDQEVEDSYVHHSVALVSCARGKIWPAAGSRPFAISSTRAGMLNSLWGGGGGLVGTEEEQDYCTGPPGYIGWRNSFLGIDFWAQ